MRLCGLNLRVVPADRDSQLRELAFQSLAESLTLSQLYSATVRELATQEEMNRFIAEWRRIKDQVPQ